MTPEVDLSRCIIVIPTFRRRELLLRLLHSLTPTAGGQPLEVVVGDNDCDPAIEAAIAQESLPGLAVRYIPIPDRGVAQVRNGLIAEALRQKPDLDWIAMLDDDGHVDPTWLSTLLACGAAHSADLVGGPILGVLPDGANIFARNSIFSARRRWKSGPVETLNTTQNLAISRHCVDLVGQPLFDTRYGGSGGEDYDLFRNVAKAGGRLVWCDEAEVTEPAPADRLTVTSLFSRYYTTGLYMGVIDARYDGKGPTMTRAIKGLLQSLLDVPVSLVRLQPDRAARSALTASHQWGRIKGLMGASAARYA